MRRRALVLAALGCLLLVGCSGVRSFFDAVQQIERLGCSSPAMSSVSSDGSTSVSVTCTSSLQEQAAVRDLQVAVLRVVWRTVPGAITSLRATVRAADGDLVEPPLLLTGRVELIERLGPRDPDLDRRGITDGAGRVVGGVLGGLFLTTILTVAVVVVVLRRRSRGRAAAGPAPGWGPAVGRVPDQVTWPVSGGPAPPPPPPPPSGQQPGTDVWRTPG